jgi:4-hydroxy-tetrahydrodipicolinate reductase
MIKLILTGSNGTMGKKVIDVLKENNTFKIVAGVDRTFNESVDFQQFKTIQDVDVEADVLIDFSHYTLVPDILDYCKATQTPGVICTTGLEEQTIKTLEAYAKEVALFKSGNMSLGINLLIDLVTKASDVLQDKFDIEIIEKHHNKKVDAPSGTAKMIADGINEAFNQEKNYTYGRKGSDTKRTPDEIGIHAIRGGTIVGEHSVIFAGNDEILEIKHSALSKKVFVEGALKAAKFIINKDPKLYNMNDLLT